MKAKNIVSLAELQQTSRQMMDYLLSFGKHYGKLRHACPARANVETECKLTAELRQASKQKIS